MVKCNIFNWLLYEELYKVSIVVYPFSEENIKQTFNELMSSAELIDEKMKKALLLTVYHFLL